MRRKDLIRYAVPLVGLALSACQFGTDVGVQGTALSPVITLAKAGPLGFGAPMFKDLDVSMHGGDHRTIWRISPLNPGCWAPGKQIAYGKVPEYYVASTPPAPLAEGQIYDVFVDGCGPTGQASFQVVNGKVVNR